MSSGAPFFSILIPCYNVERYVEECISSVEHQTFDDWEIIAIDDGATDSTGTLLDTMQARLSGKMHVVHTVNQGLLLARREAFRRASGSYVMCLDADDALRTDALDCIHSALEKSPGCLVQFKYSKLPDFSGPAEPVFGEEIRCDTPTDIVVLRRLICKSSRFNGIWSKCIPLSFVDADADYSAFRIVSFGEDVLHTLPLLDRASKVLFLDEVLYYYRQNDSSIMHNFNSGFFDSVRLVNEELRRHAELWGDARCIELAEIRWLKTIYIAFLHLANSDYPHAKIRSEVSRLSTDPHFRQFWGRHHQKLPANQRLWLGQMYHGHTALPATYICMLRYRMKLADMMKAH